jgi:hypothetical protein
LLRISPTNLPLLEVTTDGVKRYKTVGWHQLLSMLDRSVTVEQLEKLDRKTHKLPHLPERTLFVETDETPQWLDVTVTGWVPSLEYPFIYNESSYLVKVPTMVYQVRWNQNEKRVRGLWLAVAADEVVTPQTKLYRWPFSNVFTGEKVCWNGLGQIECELDQVIERALFGFLQTPNNRDLYGVGSSQNSSHRDYVDFLQAVQAEKGVAEEWLIPLSKTVQEYRENRKFDIR